MQSNIIKLAILLSYLTMLICMISGIPFMTTFFRAIILMVVFIFIGFFLHAFLNRLIDSMEPKDLPAMKTGDGSSFAEGEEKEAGEGIEETGVRENTG
ncbi:MAG: hypothetical protein U9N45_05910 [Gemmatimonadota bacterium]|nr:hypothetical protein [Gemmatimonadota bacterium]